MATKVTLFFTVAPTSTDGQSYRVAGFSESWYHPSETLQSVLGDTRLLCRARAKLLPTQGSIVAQRYQIASPDGRPGASQVRLLYYKGNPSYNTDVPNLGFQFRAYAVGKQNRAVRMIHSIPDQFIENGEAKFSVQYLKDRDAYWKLLSDSWQFRGIKMDVDTKEIESISDIGAIVTTEDFAYPGDKKKVQVIRTKQDEGRDDYHGQIVRTIASADAKHFTVKDWNGGSCTGGRVRPYSHEFFGIDPEIQGESIYSHKLGRPFFQYRGRASNRA